ncbi:MAG: DUF1059 domain-containing protein [Actinomycetota bacterium]|nr:DUF1059 domain-containing protein [Actinomycetota bacterium]
MGYQWACADGGAAACKGKIKATDEEDLRKQLLQHVKKKHGLDNPTATIVDHLVAVAKKT